MTVYSEPLDAYHAAYDALAGTVIQDDEELRPRVARQIVDTMKQVRADRGLPWLRKIRTSYVYFNELVRVSNDLGPRNPDMLLGRTALWDAYETVAATFIAAYGRS